VDCPTQTHEIKYPTNKYDFIIGYVMFSWLFSALCHTQIKKNTTSTCIILS